MKKVSKEKSINPIAWVPTAYFAMGLPFIAVNLVSTFMFKDLGISDTQIAFWTSVIMLPWTLKFLWSPFLEMYRTKKFFVIVTQLLSMVVGDFSEIVQIYSYEIKGVNWRVNSHGNKCI